MRNTLALVLFLLIPFAANAQTRVILGVDGGLDLNFNTYNQNINPDYNYKRRLDFNLGGTFGLSIKDKNQLLLEVKYAKIGYKQSYSTTNPTSTTPDYSIFRVHNFDLNLRWNHRLFTKNKFEVFVSPSVKYENNMGDTEYTILQNSDKQSGSNYAYRDYNTSFIGVALGAMVKYNLTDHIGFTVTPDYTYFFEYFYQENDNRLQRLGVNFGIQFKL